MRFHNKKFKQETSYPVFQLTEFEMGLHQDQQTLILSEMMTARRKLEEENQQLRDELYDSRMMIRLLKHQVEQRAQASKATATSTVRSNNSTVKGGNPAKYFRALEWKLYMNQEARRKKQNRKHLWKSAIAPGKKTFAVVKPEHSSSQVPTIRQPMPIRAKPKEAQVRSGTCTGSNTLEGDNRRSNQQVHRPGTPVIQRPPQPRNQGQIKSTRRVHSLLTTSTARGTTKVSADQQLKHLEPVIAEQNEDMDRSTRSVMDMLAKTLIKEYSLTPTEESSGDVLMEC